MRTWAERNQGRPQFSDVMRTAMAMRDARAQREQNQWQFDKAKEEYDRGQDFRTLLGGPNPEEARLADPLQYDKWKQAQAAAQLDARKNALDVRKTEFGIAKDQQEMADKRMAATQNAQKLLTSALQADPSAIGSVRQRRDDLVAKGLIDRFDLPGETSAVDGGEQTWVQSEPTQPQIAVGQRMAGVEDPYANKPTEHARDFFADTGKRPEQAAPGEYGAWLMKFKKASAPQNNINVGGFADVSKKTQADQEQSKIEALNTDAMLQELDRIATGPDGKPNFSQFLGWVPRGKKIGLDALASLDESLIPEAQRPWFDKMNDFRSALGQYKSEEYHRLLGGSQTATEVRNLANSVLSEDMTGPAFRAAYAQLQRKTQRAMAVADMVLKEGIPVTDPRYRKRFAEIERSRGGAGVPQVEIKPGTAELYQQVMAP